MNVDTCIYIRTCIFIHVFMRVYKYVCEIVGTHLGVQERRENRTFLILPPPIVY